MCGIAGFLSPVSTPFDYERRLKSMAMTMVHRGPDDEGVWFDVQAGIGLAHRRLSIIDLTPEGHQPMISFSGRYVITYNGEIYNFEHIRNELDKEHIPRRGHSDTEALLAAIDVWGLEAALNRFNGMFAFGLWDRKERILWLCRDRLGIKPLYYATTKKGIVFGSELKAIKAYPNFDAEIDRNILAVYLRHNCVPAPYSIYKNTWKLRPGHILRISIDDLQEEKELPHSYCYWDAGAIAEAGQNNSFQGNTDEAIEELDVILCDSAKRRMVSDVPLGAFLSGGIDSSTVVALMQVQSRLPVKTFSIGSDAIGYDEAVYASEVARHLGTDHTELYVSPQEAMDIIPLLPMVYDEPFSDSSQIPTFLVSKLAKREVTVSLSGDGGDELFGGYNRHFMVPQIWKKTGWTHPLVRTIVAKSLQSISPVKWNSLFNNINRFLPAKVQFNRAGDNIHKFSDTLPMRSPELMYRSLCSHWKNPENCTIDGREPLTNITNVDLHANLADFSHRMMFLDLISYLPDDILTKVDRASMSVSLEARLPLLDHRIVEFAWSLPVSMKIRNGQGKWILRQVLYKYVPRELVDRPKAGFGIPIDSWLRGPLRDWAEALLDESKLWQEGYFNPDPIRQKWEEHLAGKRNWSYHLWDVLMFQGWLENNNL
ncbi:MAG: asparagine synthase (glutamine-hydrolyzing) [Desulfobacterales bacterium C00003060]|nr:MAG: asparagine synthase (glutamine-hydrolyzing) [Desulfobacterales bacterium C00003060]OEU81052.1 MAG: asparagine synthase (glutamine-hydrolyzing) [Desulfobacterales bacterium S5133MH4]